MSHRIVYGAWTFLPDDIESGNVYLSTSPLAASLEPDSLIAVVKCLDPTIQEFTRAAKLYYYPDRDEPIVFRVKNIERVSARFYKITATSTLGLLTEGKHYGGIYTGQTANVVIGALCGAVEYSIKDSLKNIQLYGWLPIASPRDNLAKILFAIGAVLRTSADGTLEITTLSDAVAGVIGADRIYQESTVKYDAPVTAVTVTEHQYIPNTTADEQVLFEGSITAGSDPVTFSEPMHSLRATGVTILDSGANWATLSGGSGTLYGKPYYHNTREITKAVLPGTSPNIKTVKDSTLVSLVNSDSVADSLANYYRWRETINAGMVYRGEQTGSRLTVYHPYDHVQVTACLQSANITMSSNTLKAQASMLVGFVPGQSDFEYFDTRVLITSSGTFTVPEGVTKITVVLIGGGTGGYGGRAGENGQSGDNGSAGGAGGIAGQGGMGGKVYRFTLSVTPGQTFSVTVGVGGAGGVTVWGINNDPGKPGTATTFGDKSSASGTASALGFTDPITGQLFAVAGRSGINGTAGGKGATSKTSAAQKGEDLNLDDLGGAPGENSLEGISVWVGSSGPYHFDFKSFGGGGGGGGAAYGKSGNRGGNGLVSEMMNTTVRPPIMLGETPWGGNGGAGGSVAIGPGKSAMRGGGGDGGHGGGGGGGGGAATGEWLDPSVTGKPTRDPGAGGRGGSGCAGGAGGDGIAIVYYDSGEAGA